MLPPTASAMLVAQNYQRRIEIFDEYRKKCAADPVNCKGILPDGTPHSYADCERKGATAADLLRNFPTSPEDNQRLKALLKAGRDTGEDSKKEWNLSDAKRCLTQLWYGTEEGRRRLEAVAPPRKSTRRQPGSRAVAPGVGRARSGSMVVAGVTSRKQTSLAGFM